MYYETSNADGNDQFMDDLKQYYKYNNVNNEPFAGNPTPGSENTIEDVHPFVTTEYQNDPRSVVKSTGGPGYVYVKDKRVEVRQVGQTALPTSGNSFGQDFTVASEDDSKYLLEQVKDEMGKITNVWKDGKGNVVMKESPDPAGGTDYISSTSEYYIASDLVKKVSSPLGLETKYYYDSRKNLIKKEMPDADYVRYRYDANNNLRVTEDGNGRANNYVIVNKYDRLNRISTVTKYSMLGSGGTTLDFTALDVDDMDWPREDGSDGDVEILVRNDYDRQSLLNLVPFTTVYPNGSETHYESVNNTMGRLHTSEHFFRDPYNPAVSYCIRYVFSYNNEGLVESIYHFIDGLNPRKVAYSYNANGTLASSEFFESDAMTNDNPTTYNPQKHVITYEYDNRGLLKGYSSKLGSEQVRLINYAYSASGQVQNVIYGHANMRSDYDYHIKGMVQGITYTDQSGPTAPVFKQVLGYDNTGTGNPFTTSVARYDGNVSWQYSSIRPTDPANPLTTDKTRGYVYTYDGVNRLTDAVYHEGTGTSDLAHPSDLLDRSEQYAYDKDGKITGLTRQIPHGSTETDNSVVGATYDYKPGTNLLTKILNFFFPDKSKTNNYVYDKNGNMVLDQSKQMVILYDYRNMPTNFIFYGAIKLKDGSDGDELQDYEFDNTILKRVYCIYDATGNRVAKLVYDNEKLSNDAGVRIFPELSKCENDGCVDN